MDVEWPWEKRTGIWEKKHKNFASYIPRNMAGDFFFSFQKNTSALWGTKYWLGNTDLHSHSHLLRQKCKLIEKNH